MRRQLSRLFPLSPLQNIANSQSAHDIIVSMLLILSFTVFCLTEQETLSKDCQIFQSKLLSFIQQVLKNKKQRTIAYILHTHHSSFHTKWFHQTFFLICIEKNKLPVLSKSINNSKIIKKNCDYIFTNGTCAGLCVSVNKTA